MARVLDDYKPPAYHGTEYPWDQWLNGKSWLLTKGEDFSCTVRSIGVSIRKAAKKRGLRISVTTYVDPATNKKEENSVVVRAWQEVILEGDK
jgi:hypothetical protein